MNALHSRFTSAKKTCENKQHLKKTEQKIPKSVTAGSFSVETLTLTVRDVYSDLEFRLRFKNGKKEH